MAVTTSVGLDLVAATSTRSGRPAEHAAPRRPRADRQRRAVGRRRRWRLTAADAPPGARSPPPSRPAGRPAGCGSSRPGRRCARRRGRRWPGARGSSPRAARGPLHDEVDEAGDELRVVPTVAARAKGRPISAAVSAASVSRSNLTSMWSLTKPMGATTTPGTPAARSSRRWSLTSGSSHGWVGGPDAGAVDEVPRQLAPDALAQPGGRPRRRVAVLAHVGPAPGRRRARDVVHGVGDECVTKTTRAAPRASSGSSARAAATAWALTSVKPGG